MVAFESQMNFAYNPAGIFFESVQFTIDIHQIYLNTSTMLADKNSSTSPRFDQTWGVRFCGVKRGL